MKTTINLKDDVLRRAKSRAALRGQPLAKYMEECLEQKLAQDESLEGSLKEWITSLPKVSPDAISDFEKNISGDDFRAIEEDMWT
ncbi:hypothetical protein OAV71_04755 [Opitutales bacterium]|nr:hypothetical protein [Opitutales bacterium]